MLISHLQYMEASVNTFKLTARILSVAHVGQYYLARAGKELCQQKATITISWLTFVPNKIVENRLKWAIQHVYACFQTALFALRILARKLKRLSEVQPSTSLIITYLSVWKQNLFTLLIKFTSSTHQQ